MARALTGAAAGLGDFAQSVAKIEQERQVARDLSAVSDIEYQYDFWQNQQENLASETEFSSQAEFGAWRKGYNENIRKQEALLLQGQNEQVASRLQMTFNSKRARYENDIDTVLMSQERNYYQSKAPAQLAGMYQNHYTSPIPKTQDQLDDDVDLYVKRNAHWFDEGELEKIATIQQAEVLARLGRTKDALAIANSAENFSATEKTKLISHIGSIGSINADAANKELSDLVLQGNLSPEAVEARRDVMDSKDYERWSKFVTGNSTKAPLPAVIQVEDIIQRVKSGKLSGKDGVDEYIALGSQIPQAEHKGYVQRIREAENSSPEDKRQTDMFKRREKQLFDLVYRPPSAYPTAEEQQRADASRDLANQAIIDLYNMFPDADYTDDQLKEAVNTLTRQYQMSATQLGRYLSNLAAANKDSYRQQQKDTLLRIQQLKDEDKHDEAQDVRDTAEKTGLLKPGVEYDDNGAPKGQGKRKSATGRVLESMGWK